MRPKTNRLLMLLVGAAISGCATQTDRSSSGGGAQAQTEPEKESVQYVDHPLEESPPPKPATVAVAPKAAAPKDEATPEFPVSKYELPEEPAKDEEVEDLGPQEDESASAEQEAAPEQESSVGETTEYADEEADSGEVEDLGPQEDESASAEQEAAPEQESSVGETTEYADEQEAADSGEVEDLGTQPDESGTVTYPEEKRAAADNVVGEPKIYKDEPAPAAPKLVSVNFEAEPLFNFDKSEVRADQKAKLDEFVSGLNGTKYDSISVIGHADRIGKEAYNQKLSERRAEAVAAYLTLKGVPASKIKTEGRGKSEPVTGDTCAKPRGKALISCLQPDRRVDVSVSATKPSN